MKRTYTETEMLAFIAEHPDILPACLVDGKMDLDSVQHYMKQNEKREVIAEYIDKVKRLGGVSDGRYYINLPDETKAGGRIKIRDRTMEGIIDKIYAWHIQQNGGPSKGKTIADLWPDYVEHKVDTTWSDATRQRNQAIWDRTLSECDIVDIPIADISLLQLEKWAYGLIKDKRLTRKAWKNVHGLMRGVFRLAEKEHIISSNPYSQLVIENNNVFRTPETRSEEEMVLRPEQEIAIYKVCWDKYKSGAYPKNCLLPLAIIFDFQTGIRPSELIALKPEDIRNGQLHISRYYSEKRDMVIDEHTKSGHGPRKVDLTTLAEGIIEEALRYKKEHGIECDYIFITDDDKLLSFYNRIRKTMPILCREAGIPDNTLYSARRTFISSLLDKGVNLETIKKYVGHVDIKTTLDHYNHDRSDRSEKVAKLEAARPSIELDPIGPNGS